MKTLLIVLLIVAAVGFLALQQSEINRKCESRRKYADLWDFYHFAGTCRINNDTRKYISERLDSEKKLQKDEKALHLVKMCEEVFDARFGIKKSAMTKDGTKQKAEMIPEVFKNKVIEICCKHLPVLYEENPKYRSVDWDGLTSDFTSVIRGRLIKFAARHNAGEAFIISLKDVDEFLAENGFNVSNGESGCQRHLVWCRGCQIKATKIQTRKNLTMKNEDSKTEQPCAIQNVSGFCNCVDCGKEFEEYNFTEDCWTCNGEGEVEKEMEWEYEPSMYRCSTCKGKGCVTYLEKKRCKSCKVHYVYDDDEEDEPDDYYCDHCGRVCNCH